MKIIYFLCSFLLLAIGATAQTRLIKGIISNKNVPQKNVMVFLKGHEETHALTNEKGEYYLEVPTETRGLWFTFPDNPHKHTHIFIHKADIGIDYRPTKNLSIYYAPVSYKSMIVKDEELRKNYDIYEGSSTHEFGSMMVINWNQKILKNINYSTKLQLFNQ